MTRIPAMKNSAHHTIAISLVWPMRASEREEAVGMDVIQHGEEAYVSGEGALLIRVAPKDQADIESEMEPVQ